MQHPFNLGQGAALRPGLDYALSDPRRGCFVTFDSDGQHRVEDAMAMVERLETGTVDVVVGSRFLDDRTKPGALKKVVLKTAVLFENLSTGVKLTDAHNGLRAFNRTAACQDPHRPEPHGACVRDRRARSAATSCGTPRCPCTSSTPSTRSPRASRIWNSVNILSDLYFK